MNDQTRQRNQTRVKKLGLAVMGSLFVFTSALAQDFTVDWNTIDGGGEIQSETGDTPPTWQLSGTIGQPDATELIDLSGSGWTLTGGFWPVNIDQTDILFRDEFEGENPAVR